MATETCLDVEAGRAQAGREKLTNKDHYKCQFSLVCLEQCFRRTPGGFHIRHASVRHWKFFLQTISNFLHIAKVKPDDWIIEPETQLRCEMVNVNGGVIVPRMRSMQAVSRKKAKGLDGAISVVISSNDDVPYVLLVREPDLMTR